MATAICAHCPEVSATDVYRSVPVCGRCAWRLAQLSLMANDRIMTLADVLEIGAYVTLLTPDVYRGTRGRIVGRIDSLTVTVQLDPPVTATVIVETRYLARRSER